MTDSVFIGGAPSGPQNLLLRRANRHGLIAGATGTGKTVTLQILAQGFSDAGVPVFAADVKGDLSGIAVAGTPNEKFAARAQSVGLDSYGYAAAPTVFWDIFGEKGHPVRATVSEMGPVLLSRLLELNETQEGVLTIAFAVADDQGMLLLDLKDLRALLAWLSENRQEVSARYGNVSAASVGAIQRRLLVLEQQGGEAFFGEPALELGDLMRTDLTGRGIVSVLDATRLINSPRLYSTFLLWLLSELFEELPEVGDPDKPRLVFFFDEAHLLFDSAPRALLQKIEQMAKLIRSKGVGVYFVTQNPRDIPDEVLAQLGARVQHALRAYTPAEQQAVRAAASSFRPNPDFDTLTAITELGVGEALVSTLDEQGAPSIVARTKVRPPSSRLGPLRDEERARVMAASPVAGRYDSSLDRDSAYEALERREAELAHAAPAPRAEPRREPPATSPRKSAPRPRRSASRKDSVWEASAKSAMRTASREITQALLRGMLGSLRRR